MIAVCITTYNHAVYIERCLQSALNQTCDDQLRIYIGDDASTDGTDKVCKRIAKTDERIHYYQRKQNVGLVENTLLLYEQIMRDGCEWIAMLDGDDYWTDSNKLQTEVDFLRAHSDVGLVHTGAFVESNGQKKALNEANIPTGNLSLGYNLSGARQTNCTVLFRTSLLRTEEIQAIREEHFSVLDYPLYGLFSQRTMFAFLAQPTAVWQSHRSVSQPLSISATLRYHRERIRMWHWLDKRYNGNFHFRWTKCLAWYLWKVFYTLVSACKRQICKK